MSRWALAVFLRIKRPYAESPVLNSSYLIFLVVEYGASNVWVGPNAAPGEPPFKIILREWCKLN